MRILILSDSDSPHTIKWVKSLAEKNIEIGIFSIHKANVNIYDGVKNLKIYDLGIDRNIQSKGEKNFTKIQYFKGIKELKKVISVFNPDILHAHYASSYGLLGSLANFHPYIISAWGSDVFKFPNYSLIHKNILKYNFYKADEILCTSYALRKETSKYTKKSILITPFGVDTNKFKPSRPEIVYDKKTIIIGTIKSLEENYGIEYLIRGFKILENKIPNQPLKLLIVGKGTQELFLKNLVKKLNIQSKVEFTGYINPDLVLKYHNMIDIAVFPSIEESFGVSVLEASACGKPVIVSNVGGLPEVAEDGKTGFIVEKENPDAIALAWEKFISNPELRNEFGKNGRNKVIKEYNWKDSIDKIIYIYKSILGKNINDDRIF